MKNIILMMAAASTLFLAGCAVETERNKLCKILDTCEQPREEPPSQQCCS